jgi:hypothetical protein
MALKTTQPPPALCLRPGSALIGRVRVGRSPVLALIWTVRDMHVAANERDRALTNTEAIQLLQEFLKSYDRQRGLKWSDFTGHIEEYQIGRKLTRAEIHRFVKRNQVTIARSR